MSSSASDAFVYPQGFVLKFSLSEKLQPQIELITSTLTSTSNPKSTMFLENYLPQPHTITVFLQTFPILVNDTTQVFQSKIDSSLSLKSFRIVNSFASSVAVPSTYILNHFTFLCLPFNYVSFLIKSLTSAPFLVFLLSLLCFYNLFSNEFNNNFKIETRSWHKTLQ